MGWVEVTSAIGTASAAVIALSFGAWAEIRLQRDRHARQMRDEMTQATKVVAWMEPEFLRPDSTEWSTKGWVVLHNASDEPIWRAYARLNDTRGWNFSIVPPSTTLRRKADLDAVHDTFPLELRFRDNQGVEWQRGSDGRLARHARPGSQAGDKEPPGVQEPGGG